MTDALTHITQRIDLINTQWSLIRRAHDDQAMTNAAEARQSLVLRYSPAVRRYVGAIVRNDEQADDLAQDVVVRMLKGDFGGADMERGRFRDLLKTSIRNMVRNHWAKQKRRKTADVEVQDLPLEDEQEQADPWVDAWRGNLLELAWSELEHYERTHKGSVAFSVLRLRADFPDDSSDRLAERLSEQLGKPVRADAFRQQLKRARGRFGEILVRQIADVIEQPTAERIEDELVALGLAEHLREFLPEEKDGSATTGKPSEVTANHANLSEA